MADRPSPRVLLLDDDEIILVALSETLAQEGYAITSTSSAHQALQYLRADDFAVIISDQRMAEMTGLEFFGQAKEIQPSASRILITGVLTLKTIIEAVNEGEIYRFIAKPWIREDLLVTVRNGVQRFQLLETNRKLQQNTLKLNEQLAHANNELKRQLRQVERQKVQLDQAHEALEHNFEHSLELCQRIVGAYHPLLGSEAQMVAELSERMIEHGALQGEEAHTLRVAARLHNIGLIGISRELLMKARNHPRTLSTGERRLIHNHPIYGQTLAAFIDRLEAVGATIRSSHERYDGSGYPDGLAGESIPRPARYLAIAIHYVESQHSREEAVEEILRQSGKAFDPEAVRLFIKTTRSVQLPRRMKEVLLSELRSGMVLAKGLYSPTGLLLIPEGHSLNERTLEKIKLHNQVDPINQRLLVYT